MLVQKKGEPDLIGYGAPSVSLEANNMISKNASKEFLNEFGNIIKETNGEIWIRDYLINGSITILSRYLLLNGAEVKPIFSQVIDLKNDELIIKSRIRKSYSSLINWGIRELNPRVVKGDKITWDEMDSFRKLHIKEAGRETRSRKSWERQLKIVQAGEGFLVLGYYKGELVSGGLFMINNSNCYYAISASNRDLFEKPLFHSLMWTAILQAKKLGCKRFEVGHQRFLNHPKNPVQSKKDINISDFKAGFGGNTFSYIDLILRAPNNE